MNCEPLEDRLTPAIDLSQSLRAPLFDGYSGAFAAAAGDVSGDGTADLVAIAPVNGHVKVLDGRTGVQRSSFFAYSEFTGSVRVAVADVNGDGYADIITVAGRDAHVKVFNGRTGTLDQSFLAYPGYNGAVVLDVQRGIPLQQYGPGGATISTFAPLVVQAVDNGHVKVFGGQTGAEAGSFMPYAGYNGPIQVATGDLNYDGMVDVVTVAPTGGHVRVFDGATRIERASFQAYPGYNGLVEIAANDSSLGGSSYGITTRAPDGHVKRFDPFTWTEIASYMDVNRDGVPDVEPVPGSGPTQLITLPNQASV
ncbi:FG-GAP-like repeat-containing protein [Gemmata sp. JC673]|uniref:FG-GAP-like repeat-containing protein n=1 Tax=Gemmata algarum TaxID=2975278 RepID=A0ABU5F090_9BACT|nr:FG-GAP-like repeat-containing protein [Gemmata algarum]MDY3560976.1 FG-GAP-like repeat-containing protein [Gemmata algarum]